MWRVNRELPSVTKAKHCILYGAHPQGPVPLHFTTQGPGRVKDFEFLWMSVLNTNCLEWKTTWKWSAAVSQAVTSRKQKRLWLFELMMIMSPPFFFFFFFFFLMNKMCVCVCVWEGRRNTLWHFVSLQCSKGHTHGNTMEHSGTLWRLPEIVCVCVCVCVRVWDEFTIKHVW